jgi:uncharacterized membrane protein YeaQ/YmgE (transglycosylase-associated protein family)
MSAPDELNIRLILESVGIRLPDIIAGFAGGVVNSFVFKRSDPLSIIGSMIVGAFTANYLSEAAAKYVGAGKGATAFIVGLCGMAICQGIVAAVRRWRPTKEDR